MSIAAPVEPLLNQLEALLSRPVNRQSRRQFVRLFQKLIKQRLKPNTIRHPRLCAYAQAYNEQAPKAPVGSEKEWIQDL